MPERWFRIEGEAEGDRTLEEQIMALQPALVEARGKMVLDLGCAEGLISIEFAKAGALKVLGLDRLEGHIAIARRIGHGLAVEFAKFDLNSARPKNHLNFDIVLALGVLHKLKVPKPGLQFAAKSARNLLLIRSGRGMSNGIIRSKQMDPYKIQNVCDSRAILKAEGFRLEKVVAGPPERAEDVEYWRRA